MDDINVNGEGFLSFIRLVGCFYFKTYLADFSDPSPYNLYRECRGANEKENHIKWFSVIRDTVWEPTEYVDMHVPSLGALKYHWLRYC